MSLAKIGDFRILKRIHIESDQMSIQNRFSDTTFNSVNRLLAVFKNKWRNCLQIIYFSRVVFLLYIVEFF